MRQPAPVCSVGGTSCSRVRQAVAVLVMPSGPAVGMLMPSGSSMPGGSAGMPSGKASPGICSVLLYSQRPSRMSGGASPAANAAVLASSAGGRTRRTARIVNSNAAP